MWVELGNESAIEGYRDPSSKDPETVHYRDMEGERVTTVSLPDGMPLQEAFTTVVEAAKHHFAADTKPVWVDSDSPGLKALLMENYGIEQKAGASRPKTWGKSTGVEDAVLPSAIAAQEEKK